MTTLRSCFAVLCSLSIAIAPAAARGSQDSNSSENSSDSNSSENSSDSNSSENSSNNSDDSSADSDNSSNESEGSSGDSADSSADSRDSSDRSSNDSSQNSSDESSNGSSNRESAKALTVVGAILVLAGVAAAVIITVAVAARSENSLAKYLEEHHPVVVRDVVTASGPVLAAWTAELGLTPEEEARVLRTLDGSPEQTAMLRALGTQTTELDAPAFASSFVNVLERALGHRRVERSLHAVLGAGS